MKEKTKKQPSRPLQIIALVLFIVIGAAAGLILFRIYKVQGFESFEELVSALGIWGIAFMLFLQVVQVVFAFIPGEPIELAIGACYGTFGGLAICLAGCVIGTLIIFWLVRFFGGGVVESFVDSDKFKKLKFLKNPAKRDVFVFILMFIPGTPKDLLNYFAPFTGIKLLRFLVISTIARIPSVISSTYVGKTFTDGNYLKAVIAFLIVGLVSICGIVLYNKLIERKNEKGKESSDKQ